MYDWLAEALEGGALVVTANRRLANVLTDRHADLQVAAGHKAWRSPNILSWPDWLRELTAAADVSGGVPARLNVQQSRVLWERCLRREIGSPLLNIGAVVSQARDAWRLINDYCVPLDDVERAARSRDQGTFARAARRFDRMLKEQDWVDDAGLADLAAGLVIGGNVSAPPRVVLTGFDRQTPAAERLLGALRDRGCQVETVAVRKENGSRHLASFGDPDAELRAAGAWARDLLQRKPGESVAIVAMHLERDAQRNARLVREGLAPGWQLGGRRYRMSVNVSYGQRLGTYPAVVTALLALRWLHEDLGSSELSRLLRSASLGHTDLGDRSRMDLELRNWPDMRWTPRRAIRVLCDESDVGQDWRQRLETLEAIRADLEAGQCPSAWAMQFDSALQAMNWPGDIALDSVEYQLHNRWRELLNEFARLDLVIDSMSSGEALGRLRILVGETLFQPENKAGVVQLLGPLEAAGMEFDHLLVCGLSSSNWPPPGRPAALLPRDLQREYGIPDADPADTLAYARRVLLRLADSCKNLACSYAVTEGDAEQRPSGLLSQLSLTEESSQDDPGWHACKLTGAGSPVVVETDPVPPVTAGEAVTGGAGTINNQLSDPFSAFAYGRLGIRPIAPIASGLPPNVRGNLIHRALNALFHERPQRDSIGSVLIADLDERMPDIYRYAFGWLDSRADDVLRQVLLLEKERVRELLRSVMQSDLLRGDFSILDLETPVTLEVGDVRLGMRIDRIDRVGNDEIAIIDYKTGRRRQFLGADGAPTDAQLVAYSIAAEGSVGELAYFNVDSRQVEYNGAGKVLTADIDWEDALGTWQQEVRDALVRFGQGDVRINGALPAKDTRAFGLLSRIRELQRED